MKDSKKCIHRGMVRFIIVVSCFIYQWTIQPSFRFSVDQLYNMVNACSLTEPIENRQSPPFRYAFEFCCLTDGVGDISYERRVRRLRESFVHLRSKLRQELPNERFVLASEYGVNLKLGYLRSQDIFILNPRVIGYYHVADHNPTLTKSFEMSSKTPGSPISLTESSFPKNSKTSPNVARDAELSRPPSTPRKIGKDQELASGNGLFLPKVLSKASLWTRSKLSTMVPLSVIDWYRDDDSDEDSYESITKMNAASHISTFTVDENTGMMRCIVNFAPQQSSVSEDTSTISTLGGESPKKWETGIGDVHRTSKRAMSSQSNKASASRDVHAATANEVVHFEVVRPSEFVTIEFIGENLRTQIASFRGEDACDVYTILYQNEELSDTWFSEYNALSSQGIVRSKAGSAQKQSKGVSPKPTQDHGSSMKSKNKGRMENVKKRVVNSRISGRDSPRQDDVDRRASNNEDTYEGLIIEDD